MPNSVVRLAASKGSARGSSKHTATKRGLKKSAASKKAYAHLNNGKRVSLDTTDRVFGVINRFKDQDSTRFKGVRVEIGEGENTVTVRFQEREITATMIEGTVNSMREILEDTQAPIAITISDGIQFENGFEAKEFAKITGIELRPGDIAQEN